MVVIWPLQLSGNAHAGFQPQCHNAELDAMTRVEEKFLGLEWLFRLATEPRRLWKRYLKHNPRYLVLLALQLLARKDRNPESAGASS